MFCERTFLVAMTYSRRRSRRGGQRLGADPVVGRHEHVFLLDAGGRFPKGTRQPEEGSLGDNSNAAQRGGLSPRRDRGTRLEHD